MEVPIVGAGPAGLVAAINLKRAGYDVTVYEEHEDVGHRFHNDFQGLENLSSEEDIPAFLDRIGVERNFLCHPYEGGDFYGPSLKKVSLKSEKPLFYLVRRGNAEDTLDSGLKRQALAAGVRIEFGRRIDKIAPPAIVASGPKAADAIAKGITFETDLPDMAAVVLDESLAPKGYAYFLVNDGRATLASCMFSGFKDEKRYFERSVETFRSLYSFEMRNPREFGGFGNFFLKNSAIHGGNLYVGESAGFQDRLWGFGIRFAVNSGYLAARSIIEGRNYDDLWKKEIRPYLRATLSSRLIIYRFAGQRYDRLVNIMSGKDPRGFLKWLYVPSFSKTLLYPLADLYFRSRLIDKSCNHIDCECTWCRCRRDMDDKPC